MAFKVNEVSTLVLAGTNIPYWLIKATFKAIYDRPDAQDAEY